MWRRNFAVPAFLVVLAAGCREINSPEGGPEPGQARQDIVDADNGGAAGFYWLPPIQADGNPGGILATDHYPGLTAGICELALDLTCMRTFVVFTPHATDPYTRIHMDAEHDYYRLIWRTANYPIVPGRRYRITVHHSTVRQGWADVYVARSAEQAAEVRRLYGNYYIPILVGDEVDVLFRTENVATPS